MKHVCALFLLICLTSSCAAVRKINLVSTPEELKVGQGLSVEISRQVRFYDDPAVTTYVNGLAQLLARHSKRTDIPYHVAVIDTDEVNAFAIPGGYLYVQRGLIQAAVTESELAGVLAHEIAHIAARHGAQQLTKQLGLSIIVSLAAGQNPDLTRQVAADLLSAGGRFGLLHYSREAEREADELAVDELYLSGIDPDGLARFFEKLLSAQKRPENSLDKIMSTHPPTRERIADVRRRIASLATKSGLSVNSPQFTKTKERIKARQGKTGP